MEPTSTFAAAWGRYVARRHRWVLGGWLLAAILFGILSAQTPRLLSPSGFTADTEASRVADSLNRLFPSRAVGAAYVVFQSDSVPVTDPAYRAEIAAWREDLERLAAGHSHRLLGPLPSSDLRVTALVVQSGETPDRFVDLARAAHLVRHAGPAKSYLGGPAVVYDTFLRASEDDLRSSERISLPIALLLLLIVFGGLVAAGLPVITGAGTVLVAIAFLGILTRVHTVSVFALNVTSVVGLGLGIDYSLLLVNRFREETRAGRSVEDAVSRTVGTAGMATLVSGGTVMIGFGALTMSHLNVVWSMGIGGVMVVAASIVASMTLIPALLAVFGHHVDRLRLPFVRGRTTAGFWHGLATGVMKRPWVFIALAALVVGLLAWPARNIDPGVVGAESLPPADPSRVAERLAQEDLGFPVHYPILVLAQGVDDVSLAAVEQRLVTIAGSAAVVGPANVTAAQVSSYRAGDAAVLEVQPPGGDNAHATRELISRLRQAPWPAGTRVRLGGEAPAYDDFRTLLLADFPPVVGTVLGLTLVLLTIAFRSLLLPLKAVLMNLFSIAAALGVLTYVFQEGHLSSLLNFQAVGFVDAIEPLIIFAALFGLSMDYEVFLLSRVREEWLRVGDNRQAVALGMERTGQIITSAAVIMVFVFLSLAFSQLTLDKALGVTFAVAVLLDATVIRLLLVPALMRVMGDLNWWPARHPLAKAGTEAA